jgi:hypothetical protein
VGPVICRITFGSAYFCQGGCQGDFRITGNSVERPIAKILVPTLPDTETVVPSRFCDIDLDNPSNPVQGSWIQGKHSVEYSGNPEDGEHYSPYSIGIPENFDLWCGEELSFLHDVIFGEGAASYVALHGDFNATGLASLVYGDAFAAVSTSDGRGPQNCTIFGIINSHALPAFLLLCLPLHLLLPLQVRFPNWVLLLMRTQKQMRLALNLKLIRTRDWMQTTLDLLLMRPPRHHLMNLHPPMETTRKVVRLLPLPWSVSLSLCWLFSLDRLQFCKQNILRV